MSDSLRPHGRQATRFLSAHGIFQARVLEWFAIAKSPQEELNPPALHYHSSLVRKASLGSAGIQKRTFLYSRARRSWRSCGSVLLTKPFQVLGKMRVKIGKNIMMKFDYLKINTQSSPLQSLPAHWHTFLLFCALTF